MLLRRKILVSVFNQRAREGKDAAREPKARGTGAQQEWISPMSGSHWVSGTPVAYIEFWGFGHIKTFFFALTVHTGLRREVKYWEMTCYTCNSQSLTSYTEQSCYDMVEKFDLCFVLSGDFNMPETMNGWLLDKPRNKNGSISDLSNLEIGRNNIYRNRYRVFLSTKNKPYGFQILKHETCALII